MFLIPELNTGIAVMANVSSLLGPHAGWSMANQVKNLLVTGQAPQVDPSFRQFYLPWDGGFALLILAALGSFIHLALGKKQPARAKPGWRLNLPIAIDGLLGLAALLGLPAVLGWVKWLGMFVWQPDAVWACLAAGTIQTAKVFLRFKLRARRKRLP
jgi:hypothetical protein